MPHDPHDIRAMRALWQSVILSFLIDVNRLLARRGDIAAMELKRVLGWVGTRDFREVCWLAGVNPEATEERILSTVRSRGRFLMRKDAA